jgi:hypothetical protein
MGRFLHPTFNREHPTLKIKVSVRDILSDVGGTVVPRKPEFNKVYIRTRDLEALKMICRSILGVVTDNNLRR